MVLLSNVIAALAFFIMPAQTSLYDANLNPIVNLPAGYFVMQNDGDAPDGYISVAYDDLTGLVKAADVTAVDYTPVTKYETTVRFVCDNDGQPVNLRAAPYKSAEVLKIMENGAGGHSYGITTGDALIKGGDTLWYYVNADGMRGYVYYAHVRVDGTPPNIIEKVPPPQPETPTDADPAETEKPKAMSKTAAIILIVALCIPVPFIMFCLFRKPKDDK